MPKVSLRYHQDRDAQRLYDILNNPHFIYFPAEVKSVAAEVAWIKLNIAKRRANLEWSYAILYQDVVAGGIGIKINQTRKYIGEIGYFIDEEYWGRGIATAAVKLIENIGFKKLGLSRLEILMRPENKPSEKVAKKNGYKKEGKLKKYLKDKQGQLHDAWLYAKIR